MVWRRAATRAAKDHRDRSQDRFARAHETGARNTRRCLFRQGARQRLPDTRCARNPGDHRMKVELVYDTDCPNVPQARARLIMAFAAAKLAPRWQEWSRSGERSPEYVRRYGSPPPPGGG